MTKSFGSCSILARGVVARLFVSLTLVLAALFATTSPAQRIEMTKIVYRMTGPKIAPDAPITKPIAIYRAGEKYTRVEYSPDPSHNTQLLKITKEPDDWLINLADKSAKHMLDAGPSFVSRNPIVWMPKPPGLPDPDERFKDLEFGNEAKFFLQNHARDLGLRKIDGKDAKAFAITNGAREVTLFLDAETEKPLQMDVAKDGEPEISIHYIAYEANLPFDPALFELPQGLKITETKQ